MSHLAGASVRDSVFKSSFGQMIIIAFFWGENPQFPAPLGNEIVVLILLRWSPELTVILQHLHFTDVETEAQRG